MLSVRGLHKDYGTLRALDGVSFDLDEGDVMGFLGPNGAGKSTAMRIITGFIPATSGTATVDGFDVARDPLEVQRRIGYLPEHTPLYGDMRVGEYLAYRARIKGVPRREVQRRVGYVIERCWLAERRRQIIDTLSKGFRQRVGIADAMVGDPKLLILDEPTIGLDPNQIREVRKLMRELGESHTLLLSTHILPEVEMVCDRVVIVAYGRTVEDDTVPGLLRRYEENALRVVLRAGAETQEGELVEAFGRADGVAAASVQERDGVRWTLRLDLTEDADPARTFHACSSLGSERGWALYEVARERSTLEQIFVRLTEGGPVARSLAGATTSEEAA